MTPAICCIFENIIYTYICGTREASSREFTRASAVSKVAGRANCLSSLQMTMSIFFLCFIFYYYISDERLKFFFFLLARRTNHSSANSSIIALDQKYFYILSFTGNIYSIQDRKARCCVSSHFSVYIYLRR